MRSRFETRKQLFWANWRVEMLATLASTAFLIGWCPAAAGIVLTSMLLLGFEFPDAKTPLPTEFAILFLILLFGVGLALAMTVQWFVYRRWGVQCSSCGRRLGRFAREQPTLTSGRCVKCGTPLTADAVAPTVAP
jgi:hypothetical protein